MYEANYYIYKIHYIEKRFHSALHHIEKASRHYKQLAKYIEDKKKSDIIKLKNKYREIEDIKKSVPDAQGCRKTAHDEMKSRMQASLDILGGKINKLQSGTEDPMPFYLFHQGNVLVKLNKGTEAIGKYEECVKLKPDYKDAWINLLVISLMREGKESAASILRRAEEKGIKINNKLKSKCL